MEVSPGLLEHLRVLGASHFSIALNVISNRDLRVYCDYPAEWQDRYFLNMLYLKDPVYHALPALRTATRWQDIAAPFAAGNVVDLAQDHGLTNGLSIPVRIGDDHHLVSVTLDGTCTPSASHLDALTRAARTLVSELDDRGEDDISRIQSVIAFFQAQGMDPTRIADLLHAHMQERTHPMQPRHLAGPMH